MTTIEDKRRAALEDLHAGHVKWAAEYDETDADRADAHRLVATAIRALLDGPVPPYAGRPHDGQFTSYDQWCAKARSWIGGQDATCFDAKGRPMLAGLDFMRARDEGVFPVRYWLPRESAHWQSNRRPNPRLRDFLDD